MSGARSGHRRAESRECRRTDTRAPQQGRGRRNLTLTLGVLFTGSGGRPPSLLAWSAERRLSHGEETGVPGPADVRGTRDTCHVLSHRLSASQGGRWVPHFTKQGSESGPRLPCHPRQSQDSDPSSVSTAWHTQTHAQEGDGVAGGDGAGAQAGRTPRVAHVWASLRKPGLQPSSTHCAHPLPGGPCYPAPLPSRLTLSPHVYISCRRAHRRTKQQLLSPFPRSGYFGEFVD